MPRLNFTLVLQNESGADLTCYYVSMNRVQCERRKVTSLYILWTWIQAILWNGSTLMLLRRTYPSYSLHSASRSDFLKSLQTFPQSNISFMGNHPCLWEHLRKVSIQLKSSPITLPMVEWLQWFWWHEF